MRQIIGVTLLSIAGVVSGQNGNYCCCVDRTQCGLKNTPLGGSGLSGLTDGGGRVDLRAGLLGPDVLGVSPTGSDCVSLKKCPAGGGGAGVNPRPRGSQGSTSVDLRIVNPDFGEARGDGCSRSQFRCCYNSQRELDRANPLCSGGTTSVGGGGDGSNEPWTLLNCVETFPSGGSNLGGNGGGGIGISPRARPRQSRGSQSCGQRSNFPITVLR